MSEPGIFIVEHTFVVVAVEFEQNVYSIGEGGEVDALIRKIGETSEIICVSVNTESRTASGTYVMCLVVGKMSRACISFRCG